MTQPVAIYLQDAHDIREAMGYAQYAEQQGFGRCLTERDL